MIKIPIGDFLVPDLSSVSDSDLMKAMPKYSRKKNKRILLQADTGTGKTETAKASAEHFQKQGADYVIIIFPKITIGISKESPDWKMFYDGNTPSHFDYKYLSTYDNILTVPPEILSNAVVWIDEIHEMVSSTFRPILKDVFQKIFDICPYVIAMSGTVNSVIYKDVFDLHIKAEQEEEPRKILHDMIAEKHIMKKGKKLFSTTYSEKEFVDAVIGITPGVDTYIIYVENKKELHSMAGRLDNAAVYHSGESESTVLPDEEAIEIIKNGKFGKVRILLMTSGGLAGWDAKQLNNCAVIVADTHKNLSRIEDLYQAVSRPRGFAEMHIYKMQSPYKDSFTAPVYDEDKVNEKYHKRIEQLESMAFSKRIFADDYDKLITQRKEPSTLGMMQFRQEHIDRAYNSFQNTPEERRVMYAKYIGFNEIIREELPVIEQKARGIETTGYTEALLILLQNLPDDGMDDYDKNILRPFFDGDIEDATLTRVIHILAARDKAPIGAMVRDAARLLEKYERGSLINYYEKEPETVMPATLLKDMRNFEAGAILNWKVYKAFLNALNGKPTSAKEIKRWMSLTNNKKRFDEKDFYRRTYKNPRVERLLKGFALFENAGEYRKVNIIPGLPLRVKIREDYFKILLQKRGLCREAITRWLPLRDE